MHRACIPCKLDWVSNKGCELFVEARTATRARGTTDLLMRKNKPHLMGTGLDCTLADTPGYYWQLDVDKLNYYDVQKIDASSITAECACQPLRDLPLPGRH